MMPTNHVTAVGFQYSLSKPAARWPWFREETPSGKRKFLSNEWHVNFTLVVCNAATPDSYF